MTPKVKSVQLNRRAILALALSAVLQSGTASAQNTSGVDLPKCVPSNSADNSGKLGPNECYADPEKSYTLTDDEVKDLVIYMKIARDKLQDTQKEARSLGGFALHQRLLSGIQAALQQSGTNYNLLLFRHVLERGEAVDKIYLDADSSPSGYAQAASVLNGAIKVALEYYRGYDAPRVNGNVVPSADWVEFALHNIGSFQKAINMAPGPHARVEIAVRALGWTAKALNTAPNRRDFAEEIGRLKDMQDFVASGARTTADAQQLLKETGQSLAAVMKKNSDNGVVFPATNSPAAAAEAPGPLLPLVRSDAFNGLDWAYMGENGGPSYSHHLKLNMGTGPVVVSSNAGGTQFYNQVNARSQLLNSWYSLTDHTRDTPPMHTLVDVQAEASFGTGQPLYRYKFTGQAEAAVAPGVWIGYEKGRYNSMKDEIFRFGWGPGITVALNGTDYVMVRAGLGIHIMQGSYNIDGKEQAIKSGYDNGISLEVALMMKFGDFVLDIDNDIDTLNGQNVPGTQDNNADGVRLDSQLAMTLPLRAIFGNDAVKLKGGVTSYVFDHDGVKTYVGGQLGGMYTLHW